MGRKKKTVGPCVYCGKITDLTKEDVIPKCLFSKPRPADLVKVPACRPCNNAKSKNDDYLRDILVSDAYAYGNPVARDLFHQKMLSSARQGSSVVARTALLTGRQRPLYTPGGVYLGDCVSAPLDVERVNHIFSQIVRGLYFKARGRRIPDDYVFDVRRYRPLEFNRVWEVLQRTGYHGPFRIGGEIFTCLFVDAVEDPFFTQWWLWFYDSVCVYVGTKPPAAAVAPPSAA